MPNEAAIRLGVFVGLLVVMSALEALAPRRPRTQSRARHWGINLGITVVDTLILRVTLGAAAVQAALIAHDQGWGALALVEWPVWAEFTLALLFLDFAIYVQHVMTHALPILWRLHRVHHTDLDFDATTGVRFHPVEILVSMLYKVTLVFAIGAPPVAVIVFEIILNGCSVFNHSNVKLPERLDRVLRTFIITPDFHRVHHSTIVHETNSNFGFSVPWWDWICGTYRAQPAKGHEAMDIGIQEHREPLSLGRLLLLPVEGDATGYSFHKEES